MPGMPAQASRDGGAATSCGPGAGGGAPIRSGTSRGRRGRERATRDVRPSGGLTCPRRVAAASGPGRRSSGRPAPCARRTQRGRRAGPRSPGRPVPARRPGRDSRARPRGAAPRHGRPSARPRGRSGRANGVDRAMRPVTFTSAHRASALRQSSSREVSREELPSRGRSRSGIGEPGRGVLEKGQAPSYLPGAGQERADDEGSTRGRLPRERLRAIPECGRRARRRHAMQHPPGVARVPLRVRLEEPPQALVVGFRGLGRTGAAFEDVPEHELREGRGRVGGLVLPPEECAALRPPPCPPEPADVGPQDLPASGSRGGGDPLPARLTGEGECLQEGGVGLPALVPTDEVLGTGRPVRDAGLVRLLRVADSALDHAGAGRALDRAGLAREVGGRESVREGRRQLEEQRLRLRRGARREVRAHERVLHRSPELTLGRTPRGSAGRDGRAAGPPHPRP